MNDETLPRNDPPKRAPPKLGTDKPKTTTSAKPGATKGPSGPQIQEEDGGAGLSKEEAEAKV